MNYMETYNASEGFFGIQDDPLSSDMLLCSITEFSMNSSLLIKLIQIIRLFIQFRRLKAGINYAIIISTNGGLWRYMMGDTIVFYLSQSLPVQNIRAYKTFY
jgi:hypothetical protein